MNSMRAKRKRKDSEEESDYQFEVGETAELPSINIEVAKVELHVFMKCLCCNGFIRSVPDCIA